MSIKKRAFRHNDCDKSKCPVRRARIARIGKLEGDIALLTKFDIPASKAKSELDMRRYWQAQCSSGGCAHV